MMNNVNNVDNPTLDLSSLKFNLLLQNPILNTYTQIPIQSELINKLLGLSLKFQFTENSELPFIFSCFALSVDGKVSYPDASSGFNIAKSNKLSLESEKLADHVYLMLARIIADAVIISKRGSLLQTGNYNLDIHYTELKKIRNQSQKADHLWAILPCRNLYEIDFSSTFFTNQDNHILICTWESQLDSFNIPLTFTHYKLSQLSQSVNKLNPINNNTCNKFIITIDTNLPDMLKQLHSLGLRIILNESPMFHHVLLEQKLLNEVWLTYSGTYIGGNAPSLGNKYNSFTSMDHPELEILTLHHIDYHFLYSRQKVCYPIYTPILKTFK